AKLRGLGATANLRHVAAQLAHAQLGAEPVPQVARGLSRVAASQCYEVQSDVSLEQRRDLSGITLGVGDPQDLQISLGKHRAVVPPAIRFERAAGRERALVRALRRQPEAQPLVCLGRTREVRHHHRHVIEEETIIGAHATLPISAPNAATSCRFTSSRSVLAAPLSGSSATKRIRRGCAEAGPFLREKDFSSSTVDFAPFASTTMATGTSPFMGCGSGTTETSATSGCVSSRFSTSFG